MKNDSIQFRHAKQSDIPTLVELNIDGDEKYRKINERMFAEFLCQELVIVAERNEYMVGLLYWRPEFLGRSNQWYLKQISVRSDSRGQGIGLGLLQYFLNFAKQSHVEKVFCDIHNDNFPSLRNALKAGGLISGMIEGVGNTKERDERVIVRFELNS